MEEVNFSNKIVEIKYKQEQDIVYIRYHGFGTSEAYREAVRKTFEVAYKYDCLKWLIVHDEFEGMHPDDILWLANEWTPYVVEQFRLKGIEEKRRTAVVNSPNLFGEFIAKKVADELTKAEITAFFKTEEEGLNWLLES